MVLHVFTKRLLVNRVMTYHRYFHSSGVSYKIVQFLLSDIGEGIREVTVSEWFVKEGERVSQFDNICCVESDKATVNITSRYDGIITKLYHEIGNKALVGKPLVDIDTDETDSSSEDSGLEDANVAKEDIQQPVNTTVTSTPSSDPETSTMDVIQNKALITPAVRRMVMEHNINLSLVTGTGKSGRILKEDILNYLNDNSLSELPPSIETPSIADITPITGIKKVMFNTMTQSNLIPSFNYYEEINLSKLIQLKKEIQVLAEEKKVRLTYMPFFIKALSKALTEFPQLNSSLDSKKENVIGNKSHNIGFAVDSKAGLVVPNVKNVQNLSIIGVAKEMNRILNKGVQGVFNPSDISGGTISISNVGMIGGTYSRPLILPPELVIVALGKMTKKPIYDKNNELISADILYSSWTADHRVVDGATLARFVNVWKYYLENPAALIIDI